MRSVVIPSVLTLLCCAGVAFAALHPSQINPGKSDRLRAPPQLVLEQKSDPGPTAFRPKRTTYEQAPAAVVPVSIKPASGKSVTKSASGTRAASDCNGPCTLVSPEIKRLLDATGRTLVGAPPPRATRFVLAVVEEAKRDLMW
jgi:hypothetical protein